MTPLKKYHLINSIKYISFILLIIFSLSIGLSPLNKEILPEKISTIFNMAYLVLEKIGLIPSIILFLVLWLLSTKLNQLLAGYRGEALGQKKLKKLKKHGYKVFANMKLNHNSQKSEMDFIAIGDNGIFIIEVKNIKGDIIGHSDDKYLTQIKKTKHNTYENMFYNPIKQVNTHVFKLAEYLKSNGVNYWIEGFVYFPKKHSTIQVENNNRIYSKKDSKNLIKHIQEYEGKESISNSDQIKIEELIGKYAVRI